MTDLAAQIDWEKSGGLIPAICQDADSHEVLMLAYINRAALAATLCERRAVFFSRSRQCLWRKGEISGNQLLLESIAPVLLKGDGGVDGGVPGFLGKGVNVGFTRRPYQGDNRLFHMTIHENLFFSKQTLIC